MQQESPVTEDTPNTRDSNQNSPVPSNDHGENANASSTKITRKSHRKSRAGCRNCKTRRIKCDETRPHCANCKKRKVRCDYSCTPTPSNTGPGNHDANLEDPGRLHISEIELTYHWTTTTCHSLSVWPTGAVKWQSHLNDVALKNEHVLHLIFAFTALHLAHCRPDRRAEYVATGEHHYSRGLAQVTQEIASIGPENCDAVLLSVQLICFVTWAKGPRAGEYLAFGEDGKSEWLVMFRGIRTTIHTMACEESTKTHAPSPGAEGRPLPLSSQPAAYEKQLQDLRQHVAYVSAPSEHADNIKAIDVLLEMYTNRYCGKDGEYHVAFAWLYRMTEGFLDRLQQRDSLPLIIYAHFIVLMHDMERFWYMKGWTHHVMSGIFDALPLEQHPWIHWPMAIVGWIAP